MAYKAAERKQMNLFPPTIDDYLSKDDPARVYDAFVDALDFKEIGISIIPDKAGAEEYHPKDMLKLLLYGYSYGIRSSRKLERACYHNLSFIWLMGDLKPDYRTISRFRAEHKEAIKKAFKQCVRMCIALDLIEGNSLFIDSSPFRANATIRKTWTPERCEKHLNELSSHIDRLVDEAEQIDSLEDQQGSIVKLKKELSSKTDLKNKIQQIASTLKDTSRPILNTTDPDCVTTKSRQGTHAGYNAQVVVDGKHGLIVHSEAVNHSQDANKFSDQLKKASAVLEKKPEVAVSDCGYYSLKDIARVDSDITVVMPSIKQSQKEKRLHPLRPFIKERFKYNSSRDEYICPEGKRLKYFHFDESYGRTYYKADEKDCLLCQHFGTCTKSRNGRLILRLSHETLQERLKKTYLSSKGQNIYKLRKEKAELPFGHFKHNLGAGQFMLRTKPKVDAELSILSICFNIARMITIIGIPELILKLNGSG